MKQVIVPWELTSAAHDISAKRDDWAYAMAASIGTALVSGIWAFISAFTYGENQAKGILFALFLVGFLIPVTVAAMRWLANALRGRRLLRLIQSGKRVDPSLADPLVVEAARINDAAERFNLMEDCWSAYENALRADAEEIEDEAMRMKPIANEDEVRAMLIAEGAALQAYAYDLGRAFKRRNRKSDMAKLTAAAAERPFGDSLDTIRARHARLNDALGQAVTDTSPATLERLLAEPIALTNLDALDKEIAGLPTRRAQTSNG